jgi:hypothetical protein
MKGEHDQVFSRRLELGIRFAVLGLFLLFPALVVFAVWRESSYQAIGEPLAQPIPFSHKHHVGDDGIDCRYCHTQVETQRHAGFPSTHVCLTCHSQIYTDAKVLEPLRESERTGKPVVWKRVHKLSDFVFFDHSVHIAKGVGCVECHGRVDQMPITWRAQPLQMQWCLACHRDPAHHLRPHDKLFDMDAPRLSDADAQNLARLLKIESTRRLTDCSSCHR